MSKNKKRKLKERDEENRRDGFRDRVPEDRYNMDETGEMRRYNNAYILETLLDLALEINHEN